MYNQRPTTSMWQTLNRHWWIEQKRCSIPAPWVVSTWHLTCVLRQVWHPVQTTMPNLATRNPSKGKLPLDASLPYLLCHVQRNHDGAGFQEQQTRASACSQAKVVIFLQLVFTCSKSTLQQCKLGQVREHPNHSSSSPGIKVFLCPNWVESREKSFHMLTEPDGKRRSSPGATLSLWVCLDTDMLQGCGKRKGPEPQSRRPILVFTVHKEANWEGQGASEWRSPDGNIWNWINTVTSQHHTYTGCHGAICFTMTNFVM